MPTIELVRAFKRLSTKAPTNSAGRNRLRAWLLTEMEHEIRRRAAHAQALHKTQSA